MSHFCGDMWGGGGSEPLNPRQCAGGMSGLNLTLNSVLLPIPIAQLGLLQIYIVYRQSAISIYFIYNKYYYLLYIVQGMR
jgi:hypothetical protein